MLAHILEVRINSIADLIVDIARYADTARFCQSLDPRRDVDPLAVNIRAIVYHVTEADPYAKFEL